LSVCLAVNKPGFEFLVESEKICNHSFLAYSVLKRKRGGQAGKFACCALGQGTNNVQIYDTSKGFFSNRMGEGFGQIVI